MNKKNRTAFHRWLDSIINRVHSRYFLSVNHRWIKSTANGKRYLTIPVPEKKQVIKLAIIFVITTLLAIAGYQIYRYFGPHEYRISQAEKILTVSSPVLAKSITYDEKKREYTFIHGMANSSDNKQTGASLVSAILPSDASRGITVTDPTYKIDLVMKPHLTLAEGQQQENRLVYPFRNHKGWLVYTATGEGIKEDIVLSQEQGDKYEVSYDLKLPNGTEARLERDGSIGVYGNQLFINNVSAATESDQELLQKAQLNAEKSLLLFVIPKPTVVESNKTASKVKAEFRLKGNLLTVKASGLTDANYPLSIDPSIYIVTAQQFMNGNNETNIDFDVANKLIKKSATTGARFDSWNPTLSLNTSIWKQGVAATGGYLYAVGGTHPSGGQQSFTTATNSDYFDVPADISSISVKMWGAGGGGGGGGANNAGGAGGAGGYTESNLTVTPGERLYITVGSAGGAGTGNATNSGGGGGGGGYSSVRRVTSHLIIAAGGAGGGGGGRNSGNPGGAGGGGGGVTGQTGGASGTSGGGAGGTSSSGGSGGVITSGGNSGSSGSSLQGGAGGDGRSAQGTDGSGNNGGTFGNGGNGGSRDATTGYAGGGGGGGGYYGGGGGAGSSFRTGAAGGGGGSSYYSGSGNTMAAVLATPGNSGDPDRGSAGAGGDAGPADNTGSAGTSGLVIISYVSSTGAISTVSWAKFDTTNGTIASANPGSGICSGWCTSTSYSLPSPRSSFSLVAYNGFLYALGGEDASCTAANGTGDGGICKTTYVAKLGANGEPQLWHPTDGNKANWAYWYRASDLPSPRSAIKVLAYNNRLYLMGGITSSGGTKSVANTVHIADLIPDGTIGSWASSGNLPNATYGYAAQVYNDRLYLIGGATSIGGAPSNSVYYNKINANGSLNNWVATTPMQSGRMTSGGDFGSVWGAYIYVSGGCTATNASGFCTSVVSDTQVSSINADGSIDSWNLVGGVNDTRTGQSLVAWRGYLYEIGGCSSQNTATGNCNNALSDIQYGKINQDGDASTVGESVPFGTAPCSGGSATNCNMPSNVGNMLTNSFISNGYLYLIGGCTSNSCNATSSNTAYVAISSTGKMTAPAACPAPRTIQGGIWCVDTTNTTPSGLAASSPVVFNGRVYLVGGLTGGGNANDLLRADINQTNGSLGTWTNQSLTGLGVNNVSYQYAFARANPDDASNNPGNLYILGGCTASSNAGCTSYSTAVYKCNIQTSGAITGCSTSGQQQIDAELAVGGSQGLGIMSGTVYANYIYLIGGVTPNSVDLKTVRYAKIDNNNNIVAVSGSNWIESAFQMSVGRRRSAAFGYNGYLYAVGGYEASSGVLADIEFIKINVSDGSLVEGWHVSAVEINQRWGLTVPVSNSYAYVIGGCTIGASPGGCTTRTDVIQTFQVYNNDSGTPAGYSNAANQYVTNQQRLGGSATVLNGHLFMAGGCTGTTDCTNPVTTVSSAPIDANGSVGTWTDQAALPQARGWGKLATSGGSLYYIGGQNASGTAQNSVYHATPSGGTIGSWSTATNGLPSARSKFGVAIWNGRLYVVGGNNSAGTPTATVYVSPQLTSGGNITSAWSTASTSLPVARSSLASVAYANNLYVFGGIDGSGNYLSDTSYSQLNTTNGTAGNWLYSTSLPKQLADADAIAANGYIYLIGGRNSPTTCAPSTLLAPVSANTTIASGNMPTGVGEWSSTNQRFAGDRYGAAAVYSDGKLYVLGGGCGATLAYPSGANTAQQTTLLSQPQVAKYSIMVDTDSDVFPNYWLINGLDNSIGARWQLKYRSMANQLTSTKCATMTTWGQETHFGDVTLGTPGAYIVKDSGGTDIKCGRYFFFNVTVDSSQAFGYPDDVSRGPTITDLSLQFTADPSKRLMHGRTFTGGLQQPIDTPTYAQ